MTMKQGWRARTLVAATAIATLGLAGLAGQAEARDLTIVSWGGAHQDSQREVYFQPFMEETGAEILEDSYNGGLAQIRSQVQTGSITWDLVQVEAPELVRGCQQGLFEFIPWEDIGDPGDFIPGAATDCGVGTIVWAMVMAYDADRVDGNPGSWEDFWDVETYPGNRGLRRGAKFNLEIALMADGVPVDEVYEVLATDEGVDRAFAKLDELKDHIQWWEAGAQPPEWLASGDVAMTTAYNGRIGAAQREGRNFEISWDGQLYSVDSWVILRDSDNFDQAVEFIRFASDPGRQAQLPEYIPYGPTMSDAIPHVPEEVRDDLPTAEANLENAIENDTEFWIDREENLDERFNAWIAR